MTLFEYLAIAFSLVFSFSAMRLVGGLPHALDPERRFWIHLAFVFCKLFATAVVFWAFWLYRDVEWTFPAFLLVLANPALLYFNVCALIPDDPSEVTSWRSHYFAVRRRFFSGVCLWVIAIGSAGTFVLGIPLLHPLRGIQAAVLAAGVAGALSDEPKVHAGLAAGLLVLLTVISLAVFSQPTGVG
ncbi:MAG: hypothetical protein NXI30_16905 [bacterium]|nr:hypothetical protein [bacterium]